MPHKFPEQELNIEIEDQKRIYGTLTMSQDKNSNIVIFIHGLFGHQNEHLFFNGAHMLANSGIDSYRFDLYSAKKEARSFNQSSTHLQISDIKKVISHFRKIYTHITLVAHSMGAYTTILLNDKNIDQLILLDPSWEPKYIYEGMPFLKELDSYLLQDRTDTIIPSSIIEEAKSLPSIEALANKIKTPTLIIAAKNGAGKIAKESYFKNIKGEKKFILLDTDHGFNDKKAEKKIFREIIAFILTCLNNS